MLHVANVVNYNKRNANYMRYNRADVYKPESIKRCTIYLVYNYRTIINFEFESRGNVNVYQRLRRFIFYEFLGAQ